MGVYDKAKWHFEGDYPKGLPSFQAYVHIGFYLGWAVERGFAGDLLTDDFTAEVDQFRMGAITGPRLLQISGGVLDDQMLSGDGNCFAADYYGDSSEGYFVDYPATFADHASIYHVEDTPENFAKIREKLNARFEAWRANK